MTADMRWIMFWLLAIIILLVQFILLDSFFKWNHWLELFRFMVSLLCGVIALGISWLIYYRKGVKR
jgi:hypothetical protein